MMMNRPRIQTRAVPLNFINSVVSDPVQINIPYRVSTIKTKALVYKDTSSYGPIIISQIQSTGAVFILSTPSAPPQYLKGKQIYISNCVSVFGQLLNNQYWIVSIVGLNYIAIEFIDPNISTQIESVGDFRYIAPEEYCYLTSNLVSHNPLGVYFTDYRSASYSNQDDICFKSQMPMDITGSYTFENHLIDGSPLIIFGTALLLLEFTEAHETALTAI